MPEPDVFLSYNREDALLAGRFANALEAEGHSVWWDVTLRAGEAYDKVTEQALAAARAVVVLWSPRSVESRWVRAEATEGERCGKLIPVMIEPCKRPIMFELIQTADLSQWSGNTSDPVWKAFVADVQELIGRQAERILPTTPERTDLTARRWLQDRSRVLIGLAAVLLLIVAATIYWLSDRPAERPRVQVQQLHFAAGDSDAQLLSQSLSTDLARVVVGNDTNLDFTEASNFDAGAVTTGYLVAGDAQSAAGKLHTSIRLVDAASNTILWSRDFEGSVSDVNALRRQMAGKVAEVLICALGSRSRRPKSVDLATVKLFLSGCENYHGDWRQARKFFEQVVARRPDFAQARGMYAASIYWNIGIYSGVPESQWGNVLDQAKAEARKAIAQDPSIGVAYFVLSAGGKGLSDFPESLAISQKGISNDPSTSELHMRSCVLLSNIGMTAQSRAACQRAAKLDPFSRLNQVNLAEGDAFDGRVPESMVILSDAKLTLPGEFYTSLLRFEIAARKQDSAQALAILDNPAAHPDFRFEFPELWRPFLEARTSPAKIPASARQQLQLSANLPPRAKVLAVKNLVQLGRIDEAYQVALMLPPISDHWGFAWFQDFMAPFRADPQFEQFARLQQLPTVWSKLGLLPDFCHEQQLRWKCPSTPSGWGPVASR